jgi:hypothetical protein
VLGTLLGPLIMALFIAVMRMLARNRTGTSCRAP